MKYRGQEINLDKKLQDKLIWLWFSQRDVGVFSQVGQPENAGNSNSNIYHIGPNSNLQFSFNITFLA